MDLVRDQLTRSVAAAILAGCVACTDTPGGETRRASSSSATATAEGGVPYSIDSALTLFRQGIQPIDSLENAESSIPRLLATLIRTVEHSDTAKLRALVMSRREFAYLYYPTSPFTHAPRKQEPGLVWFFHIQHSQKGAGRLMEYYGGRPLRLLRNECKGPARREGRNILWDDCVQTLLSGRDTVITRLFGGVYERDGRFKVFSYSNDL